MQVVIGERAGSINPNSTPGRNWKSFNTFPTGTITSAGGGGGAPPTNSNPGSAHARCKLADLAAEVEQQHLHQQHLELEQQEIHHQLLHHKEIRVVMADLTACPYLSGGGGGGGANPAGGTNGGNGTPSAPGRRRTLVLKWSICVPKCYFNTW
jgi:hypothetical protein